MTKDGYKFKRLVLKTKRDRVPQGYFEVLPWPQVNGPMLISNQLSLERSEANMFCQKTIVKNNVPKRTANIQPLQKATCKKDIKAQRPKGNNNTKCRKHKMPKLVTSIGASYVGWINNKCVKYKSKIMPKAYSSGVLLPIVVTNRGDVIGFVRADVQPTGLLLVGTSYKIDVPNVCMSERFNRQCYHTSS